MSIKRSYKQCWWLISFFWSPVFATVGENTTIHFLGYDAQRDQAIIERDEGYGCETTTTFVFDFQRKETQRREGCFTDDKPLHDAKHHLLPFLTISKKEQVQRKLRVKCTQTFQDKTRDSRHPSYRFRCVLFKKNQAKETVEFSAKSKHSIHTSMYTIQAHPEIALVLIQYTNTFEFGYKDYEMLWDPPFAKYILPKKSSADPELR